MKAIYVIVHAFVIVGAVLGGPWLPAQSPWSQLMLVEYVDQLAGSGVGVEIYNPSAVPVDLSADGISIRFFNYSNTCPGSCPPPSNYPLSGVILPGGTFIVGNSAYCDSCPGTCDDSCTYTGLNGNDVVLLARGTTSIDMIGIPCFCIGPNFTSQMVSAVSNALYHHNIARCADNMTYYSDSNGVYVAGAPTTSWPNNTITNVVGWEVTANQCITDGFQPIICLPISSLLATYKVEDCRSLISWTAEEKVDSFQVVKLGASANQMIRVGAVPGERGQRQYLLELASLWEGNDAYQVIAWEGGESTMQSNIVQAGLLKDDCMPKAVSLYPVPASDDLSIRLPISGPVSIGIYDARGQLVISHKADVALRAHTVSVRALHSGIYYYNLVLGNHQTQSGKLLIGRE